MRLPEGQNFINLSSTVIDTPRHAARHFIVGRRLRHLALPDSIQKTTQPRLCHLATL